MQSILAVNADRKENLIIKLAENSQEFLMIKDMFTKTLG